MVSSSWYFRKKGQAMENLDIAKLKWWEIAAIAMYKEGKNREYKPTEVEKLEFVKNAKILKNAQNPSIATELRECSDDLSSKYNRKNRNYFLRKNDYYKLSSDGIKYVELNFKSILKTNKINEPLNQILYGPPGTGKTYNTIIKAMEIIGSQEINMKDENGDFKTDYTKEEYEKLKAEFDKLKERGRIEFVTFHQSYSYEEFVEGIKPYLDNEDWSTPAEKQQFVGHNGIFKKLCKKAKSPIIQTNDNNLGLNEHPKIWKVSLMKTGENEVRKDCMKNNRIRIGFDKYGEFITDETVFDDGGRRVLNAFIDKMEIGDIVLSCYSEKTIDAIGVITSEYKWNNEFRNYKRYRDVRWLIKGLNHNILEINKGAKFTLGTVYQLNNMSLKDVLNIVNKQEHITSYKENDQPYVLIIDEINRGNISKIFGELITLIEPDKRKKIIEDGREYHTIEVTLPYSNDPFTVPNNLYIIGTMNTADKSLALLDVALRRRFEFVPMYPKYNIDGLKYKEFLMALNDEIYKAKQSADYLIGHSYFMGDEAEDLSKVMNKKVIPLLMEYFNGKKEKVEGIISPLLTNTDYCIDKNEKYLLKVVKKQINE